MLIINDVNHILTFSILITTISLVFIAILSLIVRYKLIKNKPAYISFILLILSIAFWSFVLSFFSPSASFIALRWISFFFMTFFISLYFIIKLNNLTNGILLFRLLTAIGVILIICAAGFFIAGWNNWIWTLFTSICLLVIYVVIILILFNIAKNYKDMTYYSTAFLLIGFVLFDAPNAISFLLYRTSYNSISLWFIFFLVLSLGFLVLDEAYLHTTRNLKAEIDKVREEYESEMENIEDVVISLARAIDAKDKYTEGHTERVSQYAVFLGERLGLNDKKLEILRIGALIHDIGKIGINQDILNKPGPLDKEEKYHIEMHPILGEQICSPLKALKDVKSIIRSHHEKLDGSGYPDGLKNEQIPLEARIVTVVDIFDALTTDRSYRKAMLISESLDILKEEAAQGKLDSLIVDEFEQMLLDMSFPV